MTQPPSLNFLHFFERGSNVNPLKNLLQWPDVGGPWHGSIGLHVASQSSILPNPLAVIEQPPLPNSLQDLETGSNVNPKINLLQSPDVGGPWQAGTGLIFPIIKLRNRLWLRNYSMNSFIVWIDLYFELKKLLPSPSILTTPSSTFSRGDEREEHSYAQCHDGQSHVELQTL